MVPCPSAVRRVCRVPARIARRRRLAGDPSAGCSVVSRTRASDRGGRARCGRTRSRARRRHRLRPPPAGAAERQCPHPRPLGEDAAGRAARRASRAGDGGGHRRQHRRAPVGRAASLPPARRTCTHGGLRTIHAVRRCRHRHGSGADLRRRSRGERRGRPPCGRDRRARGRRCAGRCRSPPSHRRTTSTETSRPPRRRPCGRSRTPRPSDGRPPTRSPGRRSRWPTSIGGFCAPLATTWTRRGR